MLSKFIKTVVISFIAGFVLIVGCDNRAGQQRGAEGEGTAQDTSRAGQKAQAEDLITVDCGFGSFAVDSGVPAAIDRFASDSVVIIRESLMPIVGRAAIKGLYDRIQGGLLHWEPTFADISDGGDFGYTIGRYEYTAGGTGSGGKTYRGHYTTIWEKDSGGNWRFVLNSSAASPTEDDTTRAQ